VRFDLGEALLEIGLVITSVTLLTRKRAYWYLGWSFRYAALRRRFQFCSLNR